MKKTLPLVLFLFAVICGCVFGQNQGPVKWAMAVRKHANPGYDDFSPQSTVRMESKDAFYIYLRADSPGYFYIVQENPDRTFTFRLSGPLAAGEYKQILEDDDDFIVPAGRGVMRFHVVVSSSPKSNLERYWQGAAGTLSGTQYTSLNEELARIRGGVSTVTEAPEKPETMGATRRGEESRTEYQYEVEDTYVRTIIISH